MSHTVVHSNLNIFARFVRLAVYKFSILRQATSVEKYVLNRWQNHFAGFGYCGKDGDFSPLRAQKGVELLESLGAKKTQVEPVDKEASIEVMTLKFSDFKRKVESFNASFIKDGNRYVITEPSLPSAEWQTFREQSLKRIFTEETTASGKKCFVNSKDADLIPDGFKGRKVDCVLLSQLGTNYVMRKASIGWFLGQGIDVAAYSARGYLNSPGYISEGAAYNDVEAVGEFLIKSGYSPSRMCIYGSCGESFTAVKLFCKYHDQGINLILQKAPGSLNRVMSRINKIAALIFKFFGSFIKAPKKSKCSSSQEDFFNSVAKIKNLKKNDEAGFVILSKIEGDKMAPTEEVHEMAELFRKKGCKVSEQSILAKNSKVRARQDIKDPHLSSPIRNSNIQRHILQHFYA